MILINVVKIIILMVFIGCVFVKLVKIFLGMNEMICWGIVKFWIVFWCVVNLVIFDVFVVFCVNFVFWRLNVKVVLIFIKVVIVVVFSKVVNILKLIFFNLLDFFIFVNVFMIDININGIMSICRNVI